MSEEPMATIGVVPVYESELQRTLDAFGFKTTIVYGPPPSNEMLMKRALDQLALTTAYDYAYWQARYDQAVFSAMLCAYIETGEVSVASVMPPPSAAMAPPIDSYRMMLHTLGEAGLLLTGGDSDRIEIDLSGSGELGPAWDADKFFPIAAPPLPDKADYLRHDPTKNVGRRRARKAYGRKGDRP